MKKPTLFKESWVAEEKKKTCTVKVQSEFESDSNRTLERNIKTKQNCYGLVTKELFSCWNYTGY